MQFPLPEVLTNALYYLRILLSSTYQAQWSLLRSKLALPQRLAYSIAPRWRTILNSDWESLLDRPSPLALDRATKQLSIESALSHWAATRASSRETQHGRIMLNIPTKKKTGASHRRLSDKRRRPTTIEPLRGSDAPGDKATIQRILARSKPRRVRHGRQKTWVEEYLVQWGPEHCTFGEALEQYYLGFDIESISSLDDSTPSQAILPFVATKRATKAQRRSLRRPPLSTICIVQFAQPPQGPLHIRPIAGGTQALDEFLAKKHLPSSTIATPVETLPRPTPFRRSSSAQAPTRTNRKASAPPTNPLGVAGKAGDPPPLHLGLHAALKTTSSKSYWNRGTLTGTPSPYRNPTRPLYLPHLRGTIWAET